MARPRYGYRRLQVLLERQGWHVNTKKVYRLYREENLLVRTKRRRKLAARLRVVPPSPVRVNERWGMDFLSDQLSYGQRFRILTVVDLFSRECLCLYASRSIPAEGVTSKLERVFSRRRQPEVMTLDNGTEFTSRHFDAWAHRQGIRLDFIRPGRPVENGYIESFNGKLRDECLNLHWFATLEEAQQILNDWRQDYNKTRPHSSLGNLAPADYVARLIQVPADEGQPKPAIFSF